MTKDEGNRQAPTPARSVSVSGLLDAGLIARVAKLMRDGDRDHRFARVILEMGVAT
jgi:hypothetical protein